MAVGMRFLALVRADDEVGVLERVAGEDGDDAALRGNRVAGAQFAQSRESGGRGGLAADAVASDDGFGLGDLLVGHVEHLAAGVAHAAQGLLPGARIADADGGGDGLGLGDGCEFVGAVAPELGEGIGSGGLHHDHARGAVDEAEAQKFVEGLAEGGGVAEVAAGNDEVVGGLPVELVHQLEHGGLLALDAEGIDGVEEIDSLAGLLQQDVEGVVEAAFDLDDFGAEIERLGELVERNLSGAEDRRGAMSPARAA